MENTFGQNENESTQTTNLQNIAETQENMSPRYDADASASQPEDGARQPEIEASSSQPGDAARQPEIEASSSQPEDSARQPETDAPASQQAAFDRTRSEYAQGYPGNLSGNNYQNRQNHSNGYSNDQGNGASNSNYHHGTPSGSYSGGYSGSYPGGNSGSYPGGNSGSYSGGYSGSYPGGNSGSYFGSGNYGSGNYGSGNYGSSHYSGPRGNGSSGPVYGGSSAAPGGQGPKKKHKENSGARALAFSLATSLLVGLLGGAAGTAAVLYGYSGNTEKAQEAESNDVQQADREKADVQENNKKQEKNDADKNSVKGTRSDGNARTVPEIAAEGMPCVVAITNKGEKEIRSLWGTFTQESTSSGSGVIIGKTDTELQIVTNYHVVQGNSSLSVLFSYQEALESDGEQEIATALVKDYDEERDLAVIAIDISTLSEEVLKNISVAKIGSSNDLVAGEQVVAIGNALGYGQSVTSGVISALSREIKLQSSSGAVISNHYLQTDAAINPGNSGGALFNMNGELVGINSAKVAREAVEGMGYSIPISEVIDEVNEMCDAETRELVEEADRGYLGIKGSNVTEEISQMYDMPEGVYISDVTLGSPAEKYGLEKGMIITRLNNKKVDTIQQLKEYLAFYHVDEEVTLTVQTRDDNGYSEKEIRLVLGNAEESGISSGNEGDSAGGKSGEQQENSEKDPSQNRDGSGGFSDSFPGGNIEDFFRQFR